jgi:hypothetical protein
MLKSLYFQLFLAVALLCIILTPACSSKTTPVADTDQSAASHYQEIADSMSSMVEGLQAPRSFNPPVCPSGVPRPADAFDVNQYFTILDRLSIQPGYTLDYIYIGDSLKGKPQIYARKLEASPINSLAETDSTYSIAEHIQTDGTPEGFFQLIVLYLMGDNFYLWWHAVYDKHKIVSSQEAVDKIVSVFQPSYEQKSELQKQLAHYDLAPYIEFQGNTVFIRVFTFHNLGGLKQIEYTCSREFPHKGLHGNSQDVIRYSIGAIP